MGARRGRGGSGSDEETLLHQLRREEFERNHEGEDYYRDKDGRYNLSLDDQSDFSDATNPNANFNANFNESTWMSPTQSRLQTPHKIINETPYTPHKIINETPYTPHKRVAWSSPGRSVLESPHRSLLDSSSFLGDLPRFGSLRFALL